jgi:DNA-directed RNA polymerase
MSKIIRDTFIQLHSSGILERLDQEVRRTNHRFFNIMLTRLFKFRERYAKHQIPLDSVNANGSQFIKKLGAAGSRIRVTRAQAAQMRGLSIKDLLEVVDDASAASGMSTQIFESADEAEPLDNKKAEAFRLLAGKFVKFSDILPPVPSRGTFRVEDIKSSLYFFS